MKTVLVTGAAGNLGRVVLGKFLDKDFQVVATVSPGKKWEGMLHKNIHLFELDLANEEMVKQTVARIITAAPIDAALFLAGGYASGTISTTTGTDVKKMIEINFHTAYFMAQSLFAHMLKRKTGRMIFVGARPALAPEHGQQSLAYGLSKTLVMKLAEYLQAAGAPHGVLSHVIVPSTIDTPANRAAMPQADFSSWVRPEDIAETMLFLCSDTTTAYREVVIKMYNRS